jgi:hypothetical protein
MLDLLMDGLSTRGARQARGEQVPG